MRFINALKTKLNIQTKKQMITVILLTLAIALTLGLGIFTLARYVSEKRADGLITPAEFYFESDLLATDAKSYTTGVNSIGFELRAYGDDARPSEVDVGYTVSISCSDNSVALPSGTNTSGTIAKGGKVAVSYDGLALGKTYTVTARSTSPYSKTLSATFIVDSEDTVLVVDKSSDNAGFVYYIRVKTGNVPVDAVVGWQRGYVPDNSYSALATASGISHLVTFEPNSTYNFRFFKSDLDIVSPAAESFFVKTTDDYANTTGDINAYNYLNNLNSYDANGKAWDITDTGTYYIKTDSPVKYCYSYSGYLNILEADQSNTPHIQFRFTGDYRFTIYDSDNDGYFGVAYTTYVNGQRVHYGESNTDKGCIAHLYDYTKGPITLKWQVVVTETAAYFYINNELKITLSNIDTAARFNFFNIGGLRVNFEIYGCDFVSKADNEKAYNAIISDLGIN